jgi:hypothetical protein
MRVLGCLWFKATAAAPIGKDVLDYFLKLNIPIYEVYGMSESTGPHVRALYFVFTPADVLAARLAPHWVVRAGIGRLHNRRTWMTLKDLKSRSTSPIRKAMVKF